MGEITGLYFISIIGIILFNILSDFLKIKPETVIGWSILTASFILTKAICLI